jgi:ATP synthase protein I
MAADRFAEIDARIKALRDARAPKRTPGAEKFDAASLAWRMVIDLVAGVLLGAGIGWGIDSAAGTKPLFLIVLTLLGFAAGVKTMMRSAGEVGAKGRQAAADEGRSGERD